MCFTMKIKRFFYHFAIVQAAEQPERSFAGDLKKEPTKMKKYLKIIMVVIMLAGIYFSISNFLSVELKASGGLRGSWEDWPEGSVCMGSGDECGIGWSPW